MNPNRRSAIVSAISVCLAGLLPWKLKSCKSSVICYGEVTNLFMDWNNSLEADTTFWFVLMDGAEIEVSEHIFDKFWWLRSNKVFMGNQFFSGKLSHASSVRTYS